METGIFYFSGTGNSLAAAKDLAARLECREVYNIASFSRNRRIFAGYDRVIVVYPSYAYGMPLMVRHFFRAAEFKPGSYIAALVTYGSRQGGALSEAKRLLKRRGGKLSYARGIPAVENFIPIFGSPSEKVLSTRTAAQDGAVAEIAAEIEAGKQQDIPGVNVLSRMVSALFRFARPLIIKFYHIEETCTGCGLCERVCPAHAIKVEGGLPRFSNNCELCQACINWCPQRAISFARVNPETARYTNKNVKVREFLLRPGTSETVSSEELVAEPAAETV